MASEHFSSQRYLEMLWRELRRLPKSGKAGSDGSGKRGRVKREAGKWEVGSGKRGSGKWEVGNGKRMRKSVWECGVASVSGRRLVGIALASRRPAMINFVFAKINEH